MTSRKQIAMAAAKTAAIETYKSIMKLADDSQTGVDWEHAIVTQKTLLPPGYKEEGTSQDGSSTYYTVGGKWYVVYK
jgi:hypothetical protein